MLKARSRLEVLKEAAAKTGQTTIKVVRMTPDGQQEEEISLEALEEASTPLEENKERCQGCDANVLGIPFGCVGFVPYPVRAEWGDRAGESAPERRDAGWISARFRGARLQLRRRQHQAHA